MSPGYTVTIYIVVNTVYSVLPVYIVDTYNNVSTVYIDDNILFLSTFKRNCCTTVDIFVLYSIYREMRQVFLSTSRHEDLNA